MNCRHSETLPPLRQSVKVPTDLRLAAGGVAAAEVRVPLLLRHASAGEEIAVLLPHLQGAAEHREEISTRAQDT